MAQELAAVGSAMATLVRYYGPRMKGIICKEWARFGLNMASQQCRAWTMSAICTLGSINASVSGHAPVQDATAPPAVRTGYRRLAPRTLAYKARRIKRRSQGGGDDDGPDWDEGGFGGSGGWDGDNNSRGGGGDYWGDNWKDEGWDWGDATDAAFYLLYQIARWISLSQCIHYAFNKVINLIQDGVDDRSVEAVAFARCSSIFPPQDGTAFPLDLDTFVSKWKGGNIGQ